MDSDRELTADDDTRESEPVELNEGEEGEPEVDHLQNHAQLVEGEEEGDDEEAPLALSAEQIVELSELQIAANDEARAAGLPDFDGEEFMQALDQAGAKGLALAEEDMPAFTSYFDSMLEAGADAAAIGAGIGWYLRMNAETASVRHEADLGDAGRIQDELKAAWGRDYEKNITASQGFLASHPGIADAITSARMADGSLLVHQEGFPDFLLGLAKGGNAPAEKEAIASTPQARLAQIDAILRTDSQRYFREKLDEEAVRLRRETEKAAPRSARPGAEQNLVSQLAAINKVLATDRRRYDRENMGARAVELRRQLSQMQAARAARGQ
jgi:hypothetical protein